MKRKDVFKDLFYGKEYLYSTPEHRFMLDISLSDVITAHEKDEEYGASWKKRGGPGAYMVMARKMDRLEEQSKRFGYDIFAALADKSTSESLIDTLRDLRVYLMLIENEMIKQGVIPNATEDHHELIWQRNFGFTINHNHEISILPDKTIPVNIPTIFPEKSIIHQPDGVMIVDGHRTLSPRHDIIGKVVS